MSQRKRVDKSERKKSEEKKTVWEEVDSRIKQRFKKSYEKKISRNI